MVSEDDNRSVELPAAAEDGVDTKVLLSEKTGAPPKIHSQTSRQTTSAACTR